MKTLKFITKTLCSAFLFCSLVISTGHATSNNTLSKSELQLTVHDLGSANKRKLLRYTFQPGQVEELSFRQAFSENKAYLGNANHNLTIDLNAVTTIKKVFNNGSAVVSFSINKVDVNYKANIFSASKLKEIKTLFSSLQGVSGEYLVDTQGNKKITHIHSSRHANHAKIKDKIKQVIMLTSQSIIFPTQAVGAGAKWTVHQTVVSEDGIRAVQKVNFKVNSIHNNTVKLNTEVTQHSDIKSLNWWLKTYSANGKGELTLQLNSLVPVSTSTLNSKAVITHFGMSLDLPQSMTIQSKKI
jgi:hypothetical protein